jgi:hypothetical protein
MVRYETCMFSFDKEHRQRETTMAKKLKLKLKPHTYRMALKQINQPHVINIYIYIDNEEHHTFQMKKSHFQTLKHKYA